MFLSSHFYCLSKLKGFTDWHRRGQATAIIKLRLLDIASVSQMGMLLINRLLQGSHILPVSSKRVLS